MEKDIKEELRKKVSEAHSEFNLIYKDFFIFYIGLFFFFSGAVINLFSNVVYDALKQYEFFPIAVLGAFSLTMFGAMKFMLEYKNKIFKVQTAKFKELIDEIKSIKKEKESD